MVGAEDKRALTHFVW